MNYLFTFWVKSSSGDLIPNSIKSKSLALAWVELRKKMELSMRYVKRIDIEPLEPEEHSDTIVVNIVNLASKLAHLDVRQFYQQQQRKYLRPSGVSGVFKGSSEVYTLEAQALFEQFYDEYYNKIKYAKL